ncbi:crtp1 [Symbiodinium natans]|uniref:Crtp1 protein n=1 Tax=Symbiodinium natans TaxID=878477 RepID=A0A812UR95_9DINO|nr:crtp1 [Symbiodinium natans]
MAMALSSTAFPCRKAASDIGSEKFVLRNRLVPLWLSSAVNFLRMVLQDSVAAGWLEEELPAQTARSGEDAPDYAAAVAETMFTLEIWVVYTGVVNVAAQSQRLARSGDIEKPMWDYAASNPLLLGAFGLCEGAFFPLVFFSAARLPGSLVQVLNQTLIPFTVLFSRGFLKRRYDGIQMLGVAVWYTGSKKQLLEQAQVCCSHGHAAKAMVVKESVFVQFSKLNETQGGIKQDQWMCLFGFFLKSYDQPGSYSHRSFACIAPDAALFLSIGTCCRCAVQLLAWPAFLQLVSPGTGIRSSAVAGATAMMHSAVLPLTIFYIAANVGISITALLLVQRTSASTVVLANVVALPLSALIFCLPLPSLERQVFHWRFAVSLLLVVLGNLLYSHRSLSKK